MDRNRQINFLLRLAVTAAGLVLFWLFFRYALFWLLPFLIALGLSGLMEPWILWCRKKLGFRRSFTSAVLTLLLASALVFGVFWLLSRLFQEAYALLDQLPTLLGGLPGLVDQVQQKAQRLCAACPQELQLWVERLSDTLAQQGAEAAGDFSARMLGEMTAFATQLPSIGLFLITTVLAVYYTSSRYPDIRSFLLCQLPKRLRQPALGMRRNINGTLGRWCKAQLLLTLLTFSELLIGFFLSLTIESIQFFINRGTDLDDLILNTTGALLGYFLYQIFCVLFPKTAARFRCHTRKEGCAQHGRAV